ncbi:unnamed protein product [Caenorhabditis angaria]|uniref:receptor protein-tyrosine kinase n=1 Tax=Caenorhabditis angaria TaxID=860376 RepID=A0A9P1IEU6_9PELO|nr:unnamed protein product [Caenorhabditis angaria]
MRGLIPIIFFLTTTTISIAQGYQEVLFDLAKTTGELHFEQVSLRHEREDVWMEETWRNPLASPDDKHVNQRAFVTCNYDMINPSNWLFTHFIGVKSARRLYLELLFNTRDCDQYTNPKSCKETFSVYMKQYKSGSAKSQEDKIDRETFNAEGMDWQNIGRLARSNLNMTTETLAIALDPKTKNVRFAFEEQGICLSLLNIKVYYKVCDEFSDGLVHFSPHVTGPKESDIIEMNGTCIENASRKFQGVELRGLCMPTGQAMKTSGECECDAGFSRNSDEKCETCPPNTFREKDAARPECQACPENSFSKQGAESCRCRNGFFRADDEPNTAPCSQPPSKPVKLAASAVSASSARISWDEPASLGGRAEVWYEVQCRGDCSAVQMTPPGDSKLSGRYVQINGLKASQDYTFLVFAKNRVSAKSADPLGKNAVIDIRTKTEEEDVAPVAHLRIDAAQADAITISWSVSDASFQEFEVEVRPSLKAARAFETRSVNTTYTTFSGLKDENTYTFRVRVKDDLRWSESIAYQNGRGIVQVNSSRDLAGAQDFLDNAGSALLMVIAGILVVIAIALCMILMQKRTKNRKQMSDLDVLDTYKQDSMTPDYHTTSRHHNSHNHQMMHHHQMSVAANNSNSPNDAQRAAKMNAPLIPFGSPISQPPPYYGGCQTTSGKYKTYVDPTTYEDPYQALIEFTFDIDPQDVFITQVIGGGEFGDVCLGGLARTSAAATRKGTLKSPQEPYETVAIKTLKSGSTPKAKAEFLTEATIMGQFSHPNVIRLIGVVTLAEPVMIVAEYMQNGSLDQFLRQIDTKGEKLAWEKLAEMLYGIASGMKYLTDMGYVHRDLAARNVLVDVELRCKIADFGLSRGISGSAEPEYTTQGGKIPVRWTAPEAITHRKFTAASDVWSFGVVIWEALSYGERPYWDWTNQKVISEVMLGYRLPPPMDAPIGIYRIAQWCWRFERHERPSFAQLLAHFHKLILQPGLIESDLGEIGGKSRSQTNLYGTMNLPNPPQQAAPMPNLDEFLRQLGLNHVYGQLVSNNIHTVADLAQTSHLDLLACGLISQECSLIRDGLNGRPGPPARTASARTISARRDEGFFV